MASLREQIRALYHGFPSFHASLFPSFSSSSSFSLYLFASTNSRIWENCNSIFRRVRLEREDARIILYFSFLFFDVWFERTYEPFWKNFSSPRGSPATIIGQSRKAHESLLRSCFFFSLLGLCELVNHPTKKKVAIRFRD